MDGPAIARAVHVLAIVVWIGGVAMATTVVLPLARGRGEPIEARLAFFEKIERRFVWQARAAVVLVALSGFYMVDRFGLWGRFADAEFWWMHAMVGTWLIFSLLLFVGEPLILSRLVRRRVAAGDERVFTMLQRVHWALLALSLVTVFAAVAGSHGMALVP
jgi:uncharacterized membrane protein